MQTVYASGGGGGGSHQTEIADGADVVFTDTVTKSSVFNRPIVSETCLKMIGKGFYRK